MMASRKASALRSRRDVQDRLEQPNRCSTACRLDVRLDPPDHLVAVAVTGDCVLAQQRQQTSFHRASQEAENLAAPSLLFLVKRAHHQQRHLQALLKLRILGHEALRSGEAPVPPQSTVFLRAARQLQFLGPVGQPCSLRPLDLSVGTCSSFCCLGGCLQGHLEDRCSCSLLTRHEGAQGHSDLPLERLTGPAPLP